MPACINKGSYLFVELDEQYSLNLFITTIHEVAEKCKRVQLDKLLIDITKVTGNPNMIDRYEIGDLIAKVCGTKIKAAIIGKKSTINYLGEDASSNRVARFMIFS